MKLYTIIDWKNSMKFSVVAEDLTKAYESLVYFFENQDDETSYSFRHELEDYKKVNPADPSTYLHLKTNRYELEIMGIGEVLVSDAQ